MIYIALKSQSQLPLQKHELPILLVFTKFLPLIVNLLRRR